MWIACIDLATAAALLASPDGSVAGEDERPRRPIYLHGRIVQQEQSARPRHPEYGYYELEKILVPVEGRPLRANRAGLGQARVLSGMPKTRS